MKRLLNWWFRLSLPQREPDTTPAGRERTRYARLTSGFTLLILITSILSLPLSLNTVTGPLTSILAFVSLGVILISLGCNKAGLNIVAAALVVLNSIIQVTNAMATNPLDPSVMPVLDLLAIAVILAGALMPPVAALVAGALNSVIIVLILTFQQHTASYDQALRTGEFAITVIMIPLMLQIIVAIITYVIMHNLQLALRRADRAEEIAALQKDLTQHERARAREQQSLAEGIAVIEQVHTAVANGNLDARVPLQTEHVLWQIAVPLNNLLNRLQQWKWNADQFERTRLAINYAVKELQRARIQQTPVLFQQQTGTPIDPLLAEMNHLAEDSRPTHSSQ
ncbi:MAG: hypothetical protein H0W02_02770, partial [Ktedonobacteraceae bacterium]|nr:hypothetical protein [Ktedonobacteraceae bacterium]